MRFFARPWVLLVCYALCFIVCSHGEKQSAHYVGDVVKVGELKPLVSTEFGRVTGARVSDGNETFLLHFITLDPNSLFLPVLLHQDMVFYVHTGSGRLSYSGEKEMQRVDLGRGDVFRLESGTVFFVQSNLDQERQKLRIYAIFGDQGEDLRDPLPYGPYSSIRDLILGFDNRTLQETFKVPEGVIEELKGGQKPESIIHGVQQTEKQHELTEKLLMSRGAFNYGIFDITNKNNIKNKKKSDLYNIFSEKRDFQNCNGWSTTVTSKKSSVLKHSKFGLFMVNLTHGGMMGPHWNPKASEIAVVLQGKGMVRVVCPGMLTDRECRSSRFAVEEGDVFVVPRNHPMAQLAFNNDSFVFVGYSTAVQANHPQYIAGRASVLRALDRQIVAMSFGVNVTTLDKIVNPQGQSVILSCVSCAEEEYRVMTEEIQREKEKEEEEARKREEEKRKREEEEAKKRREQEEAARRAEEERKAEEERRAREEREAKQRKEEQKRAEEERRKQQEEQEAQRQREEEEKKAEQEREAQRQREEEEAQRQREAQKQREEEEREAAEKRAREEARQQQQAEAARKAQEAAERAAEEREAAAKREEEEARRQEQGGGQGQGGQGGGEQQPGGGQGGGEQQPGGGQGGGEQEPGAQRQREEEEAQRQREEEQEREAQKQREEERETAEERAREEARQQQKAEAARRAQEAAERTAEEEREAAAKREEEEARHQEQGGGQGQSSQGGGEQQPGGSQGGGEQEPGGGQGQSEQQPSGGQGGEEKQPGGGQGQGGEQQPGGGSQGQGGEQQPGGGQGREQQPRGGQGGEQQPGGGQPSQEEEETMGQPGGTGYAWRIMI